MSPCINPWGVGGQPGTNTSTGMILSTPWSTEYVGNGPPEIAQFPIAMTHFGSGICSHRRLTTGAIFLVTVPATMNKSACRGEARNNSIPKRERSYREHAVATISIAQHARPEPSGHKEFFCAQQMNSSSLVNINDGFSSNGISSIVLVNAPPEIKRLGFPGIYVPDHQYRKEDHDFDQPEPF